MKLQLSVSLPDRSPADLDELVRQLDRDIDQGEGLNSSRATSTAPAGSKGDAVTISSIIVTLATHGAAIVLAETLMSYVHREPRVAITFKRPDGTRVEINSKTIQSKDVVTIAKMLRNDTVAKS